MEHQLAPPPTPSLTRKRKAAVIVQLLISGGGRLSLSSLPEAMQESLTRELGAIRRVDRETVSSVAEEFAQELEAIGLSAPGGTDSALTALAEHLSPNLASRLRSELVSARNGDHWPTIIAMSSDDIVRIMLAESIEICTVVLSKLPVAQAAEVLGKLPGDYARRITFAMSQTANISPDTVQRIGTSLAKDYGIQKVTAFEKAPVQRLGAILNSSTEGTRDDVLVGLGDADPVFADDVRKAIFTFKDIPHRLLTTDVPNSIRAVDGETLTTAMAAALAAGGELAQSAEFILQNISQRLAGQLREDAGEKGNIVKADAEAAMSAVTAAIRELADAGTIKLVDPDQQDSE